MTRAFLHFVDWTRPGLRKQSLDQTGLFSVLIPFRSGARFKKKTVRLGRAENCWLLQVYNIFILWVLTRFAEFSVLFRLYLSNKLLILDNLHRHISTEIHILEIFQIVNPFGFGIR